MGSFFGRKYWLPPIHQTLGNRQTLNAILSFLNGQMVARLYGGVLELAPAPAIIILIYLSNLLLGILAWVKLELQAVVHLWHVSGTTSRLIVSTKEHNSCCLYVFRR